MVFCNTNNSRKTRAKRDVTILILIDGFLQYKEVKSYNLLDTVTILILIDGFLQLTNRLVDKKKYCTSQSLF